MSCVVVGCKTHSSRKFKEKGPIAFHRFPQDEPTKTKWKECINRPNWIPPFHSRICSKHFSEDSYFPNENIKGRRLKPCAEPTLNIYTRSDLASTILEQELGNDYINQQPAPDSPAQPSPVLHSEMNLEPQINITSTTPITVLKRKTSCKADYKLKIMKLEKQLERAKIISKRRLQKIYTMKKSMSQLIVKNSKLYTIAMKLKQEITEIQYIIAPT